MKRNCFIAFMFFLTSITVADVRAQCNYPIDQGRLDHFRTEIAGMRNPAMKLQRAVGFTRSNCLLSHHVRDIAYDLPTDALRLEYSRLAYGLVNDPNNFMTVMDAFSNLSAAFSLYDYIRGSHTPEPILLPPDPVTYFPSCSNYRGNVGCASPLPAVEFNNRFAHISSLGNSSGRINAMRAITSVSCMSTEQIMRLCLLLNLERARLEYLQYSINSVYDIDNYHESAQLLSLPQYRQELLTLINNTYTLPPAEPVNACAVTEEDFKNINSSIQNQSYNSTKLTLAKQIIKDRCFTSAQIKVMIGLFDYESAKLEIAKYAYDYTLDKQNYFVINDVFDYASSVSELDNFIQSRK